MATTVEEVAEALREQGIRAEVIGDSGGSEPLKSIEVWMGDPRTRYPDDTIWPPFRSEGWLWGERFQFGAGPNDSAADVAQAVMETVRTRS